MYGGFQPERVAKETRPGFAGIEVSNLSSREEAVTVANYVREREMVFGVHFPSQHTDPGFDALRFIERMSPYITNVHLWTVRLGENRQGGHHPILPDLHPKDGWGDNAAYLRALSRIESATVMFEHRSDLITIAQLDTCYQWVEEMLRGKVNDRAK